jgi:lipid-binding SYLF domain-containing protein
MHQTEFTVTTLRRTASYVALAAAIAMIGLAASCSTAPEKPRERRALTIDTAAFITRAKETDRSLRKFFDDCAGYAAIPEIGKGGLVVGAAYGKGQLFDRQGRLIGYCDVTQGTIGAQIGGQTFGELIFFETDRALSNFKSGKFELAAQASAVALAEGAGAAANYRDNVAIFVLNPKGLMLEASIGGQQFGFQTLVDAESIND